MQVYIYQADIYCEDCASDIKLRAINRVTVLEDSNSTPQGPYPNGGGEADSPQHCGSCNIFLENPLTSDGDDYVREQIEYAEAGGSNPAVLAEWKAFYDYL